MKRRFHPERFGGILLLTVLLFACSGCFSEVSIRRVSPQERMDYGNLFSGEGISDETGNLLGNYLLDEVYEEDPEEAIRRLEVIFRNEPRSEYLAALADVSLNGGIRFRRDPDLAVRYYLSATLYSYAFLQALGRPVIASGHVHQDGEGDGVFGYIWGRESGIFPTHQICRCGIERGGDTFDIFNRDIGDFIGLIFI